MPLIKMNVNQAKSHFFDRPIVDDLDEQGKRGLSKFGSYVRRSARSKMRKARQKKLTEMTTEERQRFHIRMDIAKRTGGQKPKRPLAASQPGEAPRTRQGQIKKFLFFAYEPEGRSVVIGPAQLDKPTGAPEVLEKGGTAKTRNGRVRIARRPAMKPSFDEHIPKLPRLIAGLA